MAEPNTIERAWLEFASNFDGLADNIEAKRMYYSGAIGIVALVFRVAQSEPSQVPALFVRFKREIDDYFEQQRRVNEDDAHKLILPRGVEH